MIPEIRCSGIINCAFAECVKVWMHISIAKSVRKVANASGGGYSHFMYINIQIIRLNQIIKVEFAYDVMV